MKYNIYIYSTIPYHSILCVPFQSKKLLKKPTSISFFNQPRSGWECPSAVHLHQATKLRVKVNGLGMTTHLKKHGKYKNHVWNHQADILRYPQFWRLFCQCYAGFVILLTYLEASGGQTTKTIKLQPWQILRPGLQSNPAIPVCPDPNTYSQRFTINHHHSPKIYTLIYTISHFLIIKHH